MGSFAEVRGQREPGVLTRGRAFPQGEGEGPGGSLDGGETGKCGIKQV